MTPAELGYVKCARCGVLRPARSDISILSGTCLYGCAPQTVTGNYLKPPEPPAPATGLDVNGDALPVTP